VVADSPDIAAADTICAIRREREREREQKEGGRESIYKSRANKYIYRLKKVKYCL
jgi:hypothetical protein